LTAWGGPGRRRWPMSKGTCTLAWVWLGLGVVPLLVGVCLGGLLVAYVGGFGGDWSSPGTTEALLLGLLGLVLWVAPLTVGGVALLRGRSSGWWVLVVYPALACGAWMIYAMTRTVGSGRLIPLALFAFSVVTIRCLLRDPPDRWRSRSQGRRFVEEMRAESRSEGEIAASLRAVGWVREEIERLLADEALAGPMPRSGEAPRRTMTPVEAALRLLGALGLGAAIAALCLSFGLRPCSAGATMPGWKGTPTEEVVLGWAAAGMLVGLLAANLLPLWRWHVGLPLVVLAELIPAKNMAFVSSAMPPEQSSLIVASAMGHGPSLMPWEIKAGLLAGIALGVGLVAVLPASVCTRRRGVTNAVAIGALVVAALFCHLSGAAYLSRADRVVTPAVEKWVNAEVLAHGGTFSGEGFSFRWYGPERKPTACSEGDIGGAKVQVRVRPEGWQTSLEGVAVPVVLTLPTHQTRQADMIAPGAVQLLLRGVGVKPELALAFVPSGAPGGGYVAQHNGYTWELDGPNAWKVLDNGVREWSWVSGMSIHTWVVCAAAGLKPGTPPSRWTRPASR
jgi:hypothetical protein